MKERVSLDFAYQYRRGEGDDLKQNLDFDYGIEEHWFISSIVWYL